MTPIGKDITKRNKIACSSTSYTLFVFCALMFAMSLMAQVYILGFGYCLYIATYMNNIHHTKGCMTAVAEIEVDVRVIGKIRRVASTSSASISSFRYIMGS